MTTVRLPTEIEQKLEDISKEKHKTKSEIIKEALERLFYSEESQRNSYELGREFFGKYGSGKGDLSVTYKEKIKDKINAKRCTH